MSDPGLEEVLERYRAEWEAGQHDRLLHAFPFCVLNGLPMPDWLFNAVWDDLKFAHAERGRGDRSARTGAVQDRHNRIKEVRHKLVKFMLEQQADELASGRRTKPINEKEAAQLVHDYLVGKFAFGSWDAILTSYKALENKRD